jgi:hypothetical protein
VPLRERRKPSINAAPITCRTVEEHRQRSGTNDLPKVLGLCDLTFIGIGSIIGAGIYVLSGVAANELAG